MFLLNREVISFVISKGDRYSFSTTIGDREAVQLAVDDLNVNVKCLSSKSCFVTIV